MSGEVRVVGTPVGDARLTIHRPSGGGRGTLVLGHGAGGSGPTADLTALAGLVERDWVVVLVDQPWRVAGRRVAGPATQLDAAWSAVWNDVIAVGPDLPGPLVGGGRSSGARVAARTAASLRPDGLVLLSFPLAPPRVSGGRGPSRAPELGAAMSMGRPILVVQGRRDPYGTPQDVATAAQEQGWDCDLTIESVACAHSLTRSADAVGGIVASWLDSRLADPRALR